MFRDLPISFSFKGYMHVVLGSVLMVSYLRALVWNKENIVVLTLLRPVQTEKHCALNHNPCVKNKVHLDNKLTDNLVSLGTGKSSDSSITWKLSLSTGRFKPKHY